MKKIYKIIIVFASLLTLSGVALWFFGSTTHPDLVGSDEDRLRAFMDQKVKEMGYNGTVLIVKDGEVLLSEGYGYADVKNNIANTPDTLFYIASLSKSFTAVSILQLEEKGKLSVNDPISLYLPDFPNGDKITIHHLLNHSSGVPELLYLVENNKEHSLDELYEAVKDAELEFEPGSEFAYTNSGYLLLAFIIEKQSGMAYTEYVQQEILDPAGMKNTYFETAPSGVAVGYENMGTPTNQMNISITYGSGNMLSTTGDLLLFEKAINEGKLLTIGQVEKMEQHSIDTAPFGIVGYAYGWRTSESFYSFNKKAVVHAGGYTGFQNIFLRFTDEQLTVILLSNNQGKWNPGGLSLEISSIALKERFWHILNYL